MLYLYNHLFVLTILVYWRNANKNSLISLVVRTKWKPGLIFPTHVLCIGVYISNPTIRSLDAAWMRWNEISSQYKLVLRFLLDFSRHHLNMLNVDELSIDMSTIFSDSQCDPVATCFILHIYHVFNENIDNFQKIFCYNYLFSHYVLYKNKFLILVSNV